MSLYRLADYVRLVLAVGEGGGSLYPARGGGGRVILSGREATVYDPR